MYRGKQSYQSRFLPSHEAGRTNLSVAASQEETNRKVVEPELDDLTIAHAGKAKKFKRRYILPDDLSKLPPINAFDEKKLREYIISLMVSRGNVKKSEAEKYTDDNGMNLFIRAVTHDSVFPDQRANNYEMMEHLGDSSVNKATTWYLRNRFQDIANKGDEGVQIISKQKSLITSKTYMANYSDALGLTKFIRFRPLTFTYTKESKVETDGEAKISQEIAEKKINIDRSMKEDVFEAFFGCLEEVIDQKEGLVGIGYSIVYSILSSFYSEQYIPYTKNELVDFKTQLKELFDRRKHYDDALEYNYDKDNKKASLTIVLNSKGRKRMTIGPYSTKILTGELDTDYDANLKIIQQKLAKDAALELQRLYGDEFRRYKENE